MRRSRWTWRLGSMFGIAIRIHVTLLALFAWIIIAAPLRPGGLAPGAIELAMITCVFATVVVHELAHALVARRYGSTTREILLLPIGGIADIDRLPETPGQELLVAAAGPTVNLGLAVVLAVLVGATGGDFHTSFLGQLMWINVTLAGFNLIPAFPMDGGRMLRALLAMQMSHERATRVASRIAKLLAVGFMLVGALTNPMLALIGVVVWYLAQQELARVTLRDVLRGATARDAMIRALDPVDADADPRDVAVRMVADGVRQLPVLDGATLVGVVTAPDLVAALHEVDPPATIRRLAHAVPIATSEAPLAEVVDALDDAAAVLVTEDGRLAGLITLEQVATFGELAAQARPALTPASAHA